jgi:hypothetical protein
MDATQKRRIWKVALAHFGFTFLFLFLWIKMYMDFAICWREFFHLLQPQLWLIWQAELHSSTEVLAELFPKWFYLLTIPVWSLCFGWIWVKLDNWLNHFPLLGKKIF